MLFLTAREGSEGLDPLRITALEEAVKAVRVNAILATGRMPNSGLLLLLLLLLLGLD